jgi:hypothetical protein
MRAHAYGRLPELPREAAYKRPWPDRSFRFIDVRPLVDKYLVNGARKVMLARVRR